MDDINFFPCTCGYQVRQFNRFLLLVSIIESDDIVVKLFALLNFRASNLRRGFLAVKFSHIPVCSICPILSHLSLTPNLCAYKAYIPPEHEPTLVRPRIGLVTQREHFVFNTDTNMLVSKTLVDPTHNTRHTPA